jgi:hypothetical protein
MSYGVQQPKIYFALDKTTGKILKKNKEKAPEIFVQGEFISLSEKRGQTKDGLPTHQLILVLKDEDADLYEIAIGYESAPARQLIRCLHSIYPRLIGILKISTWKKKDSKYVSMSIYHNGEYLQWGFQNDVIPADIDERDKFWRNKFLELLPEDKMQPASVNQENSKQKDEDEDVPF